MEDKRRTDGNETMFEVTPIEMNLSSEWNQEEVLCGTLHSKFDRVQNYLFLLEGEQRMLTIMCEENTLLPDSIILRREDYNYLKNQGEFLAGKSKDYIQIHNIKIALLHTSSCSLLNLSVENFKREYFEQKKNQIDTFIECSEKRSDFERLPERYGELLKKFADGMWKNDPEQVEKSFLSLVGAGRGLTPAADDAIVGVLAGSLLKWTLTGRQENYFVCVRRILDRLCSEKLTTEISCKYLKCACRGEFSRNLCQLIRILAGEEKLKMSTILAQIAETGHSSGMDMLYGLKCCFSEKRSWDCSFYKETKSSKMNLIR